MTDNMMDIKETNKKKLFEDLWNCMNGLRPYGMNCFVPLLYVICAHHQGHLVSIIGTGKNIFRGERHIQPIEAVDGYESPLLNKIRSLVDERYFMGSAAEIVYGFYSRNSGNGGDSDLIKEFYPELIDEIINYTSLTAGRASGISATPKELAKLMANIIKELGTTTIYDPFAGLCTYILMPELAGCDFVGQELSRLTEVLAEVRMDAYGIHYTLTCEDSLFHWKSFENKACLATELPLGVRLSDEVDNKFHLRNLDEYIVKKFIDDKDLKSAVIMTGAGFCFRGSRTFDVRKELCEKNLVEKVILLPAGILTYTGASVAILVLNKEKKDDNIHFINGSDCLISTGKPKERVLDFKTILERIHNEKADFQKSVPVSETYKHECSLMPSAYISEPINLLPGQKFVRLQEICEISKGVSRYAETEGQILKQENLASDITEALSDVSDPKNGKVPDHYRMVNFPCVMVYLNSNKLYIKRDSTPVFFHMPILCLKLKAEVCSVQYLALTIFQSRTNMSPSVDVASLQQNVENLQLAFYEDKETQNQIVNREIWKAKKTLQEKLDKLQIMNGRAYGLIHNLGITFTRISAAIDVLHTKYPDDEDTYVLAENVRSAIRQINSTGADYSKVSAELRKENIVNFLTDYVKGWNVYGMKSFTLDFKSDVADDTLVMADRELLCTALDCILYNAHQHGFSRKFSASNRVSIEARGVLFTPNEETKEQEYVLISVSNNGNPFPDDFSLQDYVARGVVGLNSTQDGLGGNHVYEIVKKFQGYISMEQDQWVRINLLIPIYLTSKDENYEEYECKCL